jgi:hypothetical protein
MAVQISSAVKVRMGARSLTMVSRMMNMALWRNAVPGNRPERCRDGL